MGALLSAGMIAIFFCALWMVKFPDLVWEVMTFRHHGSWKDIFVGFIMWVFFGLAITTVIYLADIIVGKP